jgi:hypothetical protein
MSIDFHAYIYAYCASRLGPSRGNASGCSAAWQNNFCSLSPVVVLGLTRLEDSSPSTKRQSIFH